jgi:CO/xanthine dehydrogenase Mo-binding subunit
MALSAMAGPAPPLMSGETARGDKTLPSQALLAVPLRLLPQDRARSSGPRADSRHPQTPPHGGSMTMASVGSATLDVCNQLRQQAIRLAVEDEESPLHGVSPDDIVVRGGRLHVQGPGAR